tara:strand:+ start:223 stop:543 length:321 start_codon:yes stop_codon:yes gene_type:complete
MKMKTMYKFPYHLNETLTLNVSVLVKLGQPARIACAMEDSEPAEDIECEVVAVTIQRALQANGLNLITEVDFDIDNLYVYSTHYEKPITLEQELEEHAAQNYTDSL